ncbi:hypothetical protein FHG87_024530, partial [Trinorchestia longiramus]
MSDKPVCVSSPLPVLLRISSSPAPTAARRRCNSSVCAETSDDTMTEPDGVTEGGEDASARKTSAASPSGAAVVVLEPLGALLRDAVSLCYSWGSHLPAWGLTCLPGASLACLGPHLPA